MKTLLLMRHGKSSWKNTSLTDHERPLTNRGTKDAVYMGTVLNEKELIPQKILGSTAVRARETVKGLMDCTDYSGEVQFMDELYLAEPEGYMCVLRTLPKEMERVMIIGHNPGLEGLLQELSGRIEPLSTSTIAYLALPIRAWSELDDKVEGELIEMLEPSEAIKEKSKAKKGKKEKGGKKEKYPYSWVSTYFDKYQKV